MRSFKGFNRGEPDKIQLLYVDGTEDRVRGVDYRASGLLEHAVNTALALGRPLLVSGEPGCGKTELGFCIARKLDIDRVNFYSVKSDFEAQSLFYQYDVIRRFHAAQIASRADVQDGNAATRTDPHKFIRYHGLGRAILDASSIEDVGELLSDGYAMPRRPVRSVVIIDEIDKAARDFPNDLLNEIDQLWFRVPELAGWVKLPETPRGRIPPELQPIIVITSNLERQLPDAFLRRCVFHHIEFPEDSDELRLILLGHLQRDGVKLADAEVREAIALVAWARRQGLDKPPGVGELLEFVRALGYRGHELSGFTWRDRVNACLSALAKTTHDLERLYDRSDPFAS